MKKIFLLVIMLSLVAMHVFAQSNLAPTESYEIQEMEDASSTSGQLRELRNDIVSSFDATFSNVPVPFWHIAYY